MRQSFTKVRSHELLKQIVTNVWMKVDTRHMYVLMIVDAVNAIRVDANKRIVKKLIHQMKNKMRKKPMIMKTLNQQIKQRM